jgi:coenzyme F420-reducing hydrogenase gamma subunit
MADNQGALMDPLALVKESLPKLAVWKFASCDGCQLSLLDCEDELLQVAEIVQIANFAEVSKVLIPGPYDISLVEGSITTAHDIERILEVRKKSKVLITIGACATAGGIQALRNFANVEDYKQIVYARPDYISSLSTSTPISAHVVVDFELQGCPINKYQLLEVLKSFTMGKKPAISSSSVCTECKRKGNICVTVAYGIPCMGPVTHAGCGALCPSYRRGCYGCYGPKETANPLAMTRWWEKELKTESLEIKGLLRNFNCGAESFREASKEYD